MGNARQAETWWEKLDKLRQAKAIWDKVRQDETRWDKFKQAELTWDRQRQAIILDKPRGLGKANSSLFMASLGKRRRKEEEEKEEEEKEEEEEENTEI